MAHSLSSFSMMVVLALAMLARGQETGDRGQGTADGKTPDPPLPAPDSQQRGQQLVAEAARRLLTEPAISAELRCRIDAYEHSLIGTGTYLQLAHGESPGRLNDGSERLLKFELRMQVGDRLASLQEVRGEDFYWVRRDVPPAAPSLERVNLRQLRKALVQPAADSEADVLPHAGWIMLGGLPQLLASLERNFAFDAPRAEELQFNAADGRSVQRLPIWNINGHWKPERLAGLLGRENRAGAALPEQLPERVELILGRDDVLPLFPYRITYWRSPDKGFANDASPADLSPRELLTLELFKVSRKVNIDRREFHYLPVDQDVRDVTARHIQRLVGDTKTR